MGTIYVREESTEITHYYVMRQESCLRRVNIEVSIFPAPPHLFQPLSALAAILGRAISAVIVPRNLAIMIGR